MEKETQILAVNYILGAVLALAVGVAGYLIFLGFMAKNQFLLTLFPLAIVAGTASFFSPCAFPLLPAAATTISKSSKTGYLWMGLLAGSGVLSFLLILGLLIGYFGQTLGNFLQANVLQIRGGVGVFLLLLGILQYQEKFHFGFFEKFAPSPAQKTGLSQAFTYGFGYTLAGSGCTVPILGSLVLGALTGGGFQQASVSFLIAGITMAILMFLFIVLTSWLKKFPKAVTTKTPVIKKFSAVVLIIIGLFYMANAVYKFI